MNETNSNRAGQILAALGKSVAYLLLFLGSQVLVSFAFTMAITLIIGARTGAVNPLLVTLELYDYLIHISMISNLLVLAVLLVFFLARRRRPLQEVGLHPVPGRAAAGAVGAAPLLYAVITLALSLLPTAWLQDYSQASAPLSNTGTLPFLSVALVAPVVEEVIFRGLIQSRLARALPGWPAVLLSALAFALCHGQPVWMGYAFLLGLVLGIMAWRAGSILPSVITHVVFNAIGQVLVLPGLSQLNGLVVLAVLLLAGLALCLLARRGLALLFLPSQPNEKEADPHV